MTPMTPLKRRVAAVAVPLLFAATLTACGGGASGAPEDASKDDFCKVFNASPDATGSDDDAVDAIHGYAGDLKDVGTPSSIDGDARKGFEVITDFLADIDSGDAKKFDEADDPTDIFSADDNKSVTAFYTEAFQLCTDVGDLDLGDLPSDLPS
ncbi:hypothetical protein BH11ACT8_BH11ACT8_16820 [soil metagenome]